MSRRRHGSLFPPVANYYVDSVSGLDTNGGTLAAPFQTLAKATSVAGVNKAVALKVGSTFRETLTPSASGQGFKAYGTGTAPRITGSTLANSGWTNVSSASPLALHPSSTASAAAIGGNTSANYQKGLSFTAIQSFTLGSIAVNMSKSGTLTSATIWWELHSDNAGAPGTLIASSGTLDPNTFSTATAGTSQTFTWASPPSLIAGTKYHLVVNFSYTVSSSNHANLTIYSTPIPYGWTYYNLFQAGTQSQLGSSFQPYIDIGPTSGSNFWAFALASPPRVVIFNGAYGNQKLPSSFAADKDWWWDGEALIVYAASNPATHWTLPGVEYASRSQIVSISGINNVTLQGLTLDTSTQYGVYMTGNNTSGHNLLGLSVANAFSNGVLTHATDVINNVTISGCSTSRNGAHGVAVIGPKSGWIIRNLTSYRDGYVQYIYDDGTTENQFGAGLALSSFGLTPHANNQLVGCTVSYTGVRDDGSASDSVNKGFGIHLDTVNSTTSLATGDFVQQCVAFNCYNSGLFCEKSYYCTWMANLAYGNGEHGLRVDCDAGEDVNHDCLFENNTLASNTQFGIFAAGGYNQSGNTFYNNTFRNNIAAFNSGGQFIAKWGANNDGTLGSGNVYDHNCFGAAATGFIQWGTPPSNVNTYAALDSAYGSSTNSIQGDPKFVSNGSDFHLQISSPARSAGSTTSVPPLDVASNAYGSPPNLGAYGT